MFELEYKITDADIRAANKSEMLRYFIPYLLVSLLGIAIGIVATVERPRIELMVFGIILTVFGAILLVCAIMLLVVPKSFVASMIETGDIKRKVKIDGSAVTITTDGQSDITLPLGDVTAVKNRKSHLVLYFGKYRVLIVKNAIKTGQSLDELYAFVSEKRKALAANVKSSPEPNESEAQTSIASVKSEEADGKANESAEQDAAKSENLLDEDEKQ